MIRQIIEKCYEYNIDIHNIFIDYTYAFDSIKRNNILDSLTQNNIHPKLVRLVKLTLENTTAKVKVNNAYTSEFRMESGVKQGCPLSPTLFSLVIDTVLKKLDLRGNISTRLRQLMAYSDDVMITARTKQSLIDAFQQVKNNSMEVGLTINEKKTKYLKCTKKDIRIENLKINNSYTDQVQQYKYLGSIRNDSNSIEEEVNERIAIGTKAYYAYMDVRQQISESNNER